MSLQCLKEYLALCFVFSVYYFLEVESLDIKCIPVEQCLIAMKLISTRKYDPETIQFLKFSHCGYSKKKEPLVWCADPTLCTTPSGSPGICTDLSNCPYLLNSLETTNLLADHRCKSYSMSNSNICCPQESPKMQTKSKDYDQIEYEESHISDELSAFNPSLSHPSSSRKTPDLETDENMMGDEPYVSNERKSGFFNILGDKSNQQDHHHLDHHGRGTFFNRHDISRNRHGVSHKGHHKTYFSDDSEDADSTSSNRVSFENHEQTSSEEDIYSRDKNRRRFGQTESTTYNNFPKTTRIPLPEKTHWKTSDMDHNTRIHSSSTRDWTIRDRHDNNSNKRVNSNIFQDFSSICGRQSASDNKIIGGSTVDLGEYPWMALLQYSSDEGKKFGCGGTLISKRHVLTAAHCVDDNVLKSKGMELYRVILGEYDTRNETDCIYLPFGKKCADPSQSFGIKSVVKHEKFNNVNGQDDLAVITLERVVQFTDYIKPICLPPDNISLERNQSVLVAGWGRTATENFSPVLMKAKLPNVMKNDCNQYGSTSLSGGQICIGLGNGIDTCTGDSGGPLMLEIAENFEYVVYQIGIISYGFAAKGCGNAPSVNTFVPFYKDWIKQAVS